MKSPATWLDILTVAPFFVEIFIDFSKLESMKVNIRTDSSFFLNSEVHLVTIPT